MFVWFGLVVSFIGVDEKVTKSEVIECKCLLQKLDEQGGQNQTSLNLCNTPDTNLVSAFKEPSDLTKMESRPVFDEESSLLGQQGRISA